MALYSEGSGRYDSEYQELWNRFVPEAGQCETVQGELIRVVGRLASEYYRNGNMNWENGYDLMLAWMFHTLCDESVFDSHQLEQIERDCDFIRENAESGMCPYEDGEDEYDRLTDRIVEWCQQHPAPIPITANLPYNH